MPMTENYVRICKTCGEEFEPRRMPSGYMYRYKCKDCVKKQRQESMRLCMERRKMAKSIIHRFHCPLCNYIKEAKDAGELPEKCPACNGGKNIYVGRKDDENI